VTLIRTMLPCCEFIRCDTIAHSNTVDNSPGNDMTLLLTPLVMSINQSINQSVYFVE